MVPNENSGEKKCLLLSVTRAYLKDGKLTGEPRDYTLAKGRDSVIEYLGNGEVESKTRDIGPKKMRNIIKREIKKISIPELSKPDAEFECLETDANNKEGTYAQLLFCDLGSGGGVEGTPHATSHKYKLNFK